MASRAADLATTNDPTHPSHPVLGAAELERLRRRTTWSLVAGVALGSTGHIAAVTVATIVAQQLAGTTAWSGAPGAAVVIGAAIGAVILSQLMVRTAAASAWRPGTSRASAAPSSRHSRSSPDRFRGC